MIRVRTTNAEELQKKDANVIQVVLPVYMCLPGRKERIGFGKGPKVWRKEADREMERI